MERLDSNKLISLIKMHPELYSRASSSSNATDFRAKAWKSIAEKMNVDIKIIRSRWKSLRDTFQRCLKKARESETDSVTIGWPYFEKLLFLKDYVGQKRSYPFETAKELITEEYNESDPINYEENVYIEKEAHESSDIPLNVPQKYESEDWTQFDQEDLRTTPTSFEKVSFEDEKSEKFLVTQSTSKRKSDSYDEPSNKRLILQENDILDKKITQCIDIFKEKLEKRKDATDNFCEFLSSIIKQWPTREQCETIKYLTEYVMEKHLDVVNN
ncbi:transcription factor Adf-1-like [Condylostylus longicornis]|uniref:transcription factor Adf-1-like n=1 Tax=Condylostylus longicornis TaxID=2530218 RepID=UPI00244DCBA3|nr:transcription factor Adf-1-like [Condylostylus longicornis]